MKTFLASLSLISLLLAGHAYALDGKNYNASSCVAFVGNGKTLNFSNIYNNSSSSILRVDCVATKDLIKKSINSAWIEVKDLSNAENVSCTLASHYNVIGESGGRIWSQNKKTNGINSNWQRLSYTGLGANNNGHYYFSCDVPKRTSNGASWLGTYHIDEND
ncbi:MAG: hypothetical protein P8Y45_20305 [Exilibacterium sp.]